MCVSGSLMDSFCLCYNPSYTLEEIVIKNEDSLEHLQSMEHNTPEITLHKTHMIIEINNGNTFDIDISNFNK